MKKLTKEQEDANLLKHVTEGIKYVFEKDVLVKPLEVVKVKKEFTNPIPTGKVDADGIEEYETKTEVTEVESNFREGVVISLPLSYDGTIKVGDTIVYPKKFSIEFDLFKNSQLVKVYDIIGRLK